MRSLAVFSLLAVAACGDDLRFAFPGLVRVSGDSPYDPDCTAGQSGENYVGAEVEPWLAIDPLDPAHLVGVWQQDRWSNGGAAGTMSAVSRDGGATWTGSVPAFSRCAGGDYARATDPWVTFEPDGTVWQIALGIEMDQSAILVARSTDGGDTWDDPITVHVDDDPDVFNDKESITADPVAPGRVYAVWDRLTGLATPIEPIPTGPTLLARAVDGIWEPARVIYDPGVENQTIGNAIVVLPDGTLVDVFEQIDMFNAEDPTESIAVIRSTDGGDTWSAPVTVVDYQPGGVVGVRDGGGMPSIAVDATSGALYIVWQDSAVTSIAIATSTDGGLTWSEPAPVDPGDAPAITPTVAVAADGAVGVLYLEVDADLVATQWLAVSHDGGATWAYDALTGAYDLTVATVSDYLFLGDYQGLATSGSAFVPFFAAADAGGGHGQSDIFTAPIGPP